MESTSVYWIPVYQILEARGLEVYLVNAQHVKNVPGRKTDVSDCQWLQYLHSVGLLRVSFRLPGFICAMRSLWRHRASLIQMGAEHVLHMQKALDQMNLQIHRVLRRTARPSFTRLKKKPSGALNIDYEGKPHNSDFRSSQSRTADVPRESAWRPESAAQPRQSASPWAFLVTIPDGADGACRLTPFDN